MLVRYLVARDYDLNKSFFMWSEWVKWRETYRPHEISLDEVHF
jgi:hypothetical protein